MDLDCEGIVKTQEAVGTTNRTYLSNKTRVDVRMGDDVTLEVTLVPDGYPVPKVLGRCHGRRGDKVGTKRKVQINLKVQRRRLPT